MYAQWFHAGCQGKARALHQILKKYGDQALVSKDCVLEYKRPGQLAYVKNWCPKSTTPYKTQELKEAISSIRGKLFTDMKEVIIENTCDIGEQMKGDIREEIIIASREKVSVNT